MISKKHILMTSAILALGFAVPAKADIFQWQDAKTHISFSYPDQWKPRSNDGPDDVFTVMGPGENDHALCRLRVREDGRFAIYPQRYSANIQHIAYSREFWDDYLGQYDNVNIHQFHDDGGLGRGFGSWAQASYTTAYGPKMDKTALMFMAQYNNKVYIAECSAEKHAYAKWHDSFLSVIKSIDFRKEIHELPTGNYRNFLKEKVRVHGPRDIDISYY